MQLQGVAALTTITNRSYCRQVADVYAGIGDCAPRDPVLLLEPFGRNTAPAIALGAIWARARAARRRRCAAGAAVGPSDPRPRGVRKRGSRPRSNGAHQGATRHLRHCADASGDRLRLHRMRRSIGEAGRVPRGVSRAASSRSLRSPTALEYVARREIFSGTRACSPSRRVRCWTALARHAPEVLDAARRRSGSQIGAADFDSTFEIDATLFAAMPGHFDRLCGDGTRRRSLARSY